jgi:hypothetical protein
MLHPENVTDLQHSGTEPGSGAAEQAIAAFTP